MVTCNSQLATRTSSVMDPTYHDTKKYTTLGNFYITLKLLEYFLLISFLLSYRVIFDFIIVNKPSFLATILIHCFQIFYQTYPFF